MTKNQRGIIKINVMILAVVLVGIIAFYGYTFYINPVERSTYICRAGDGTVHPEESPLGCSWIIDWKHCTNGTYVTNTCTKP